MYKKLSLILAIGLVLTMAGCGGSSAPASSAAPAAPAAPAASASAAPATPAPAAPAKKIVLQFGHTVAVEHPIHKSALFMQKRLAEESNGQIELEIFPGGQLGGEKENLEGLMAGTHMFHMGTQAPLSNWLPQFMIFDLPYLVKSYEEADKLVSQPFADELMNLLPTVGLYGLGWCENGFRHFTNSKLPITKATDLKGLKMRVMQNALMIDTMAIWGIDPQTLPFPEVYSALQQKVVDGQENPLTIIADNRIPEVQKYMTLSYHFYSPFILYASKPIMDSLPKDIQEIIKKVGAETAAFEKDLNRSSEKGALERIDAISDVNELPESERQALKDMALPIYEKYREKIGTDIYDLVVKK